MIANVLLVALGGFLGAMARDAICEWTWLIYSRSDARSTGVDDVKCVISDWFSWFVYDVFHD